MLCQLFVQHTLFHFDRHRTHNVGLVEADAFQKLHALLFRVLHHLDEWLMDFSQALLERFTDVLIGPTTVIDVVDDPVQVILVNHLIVDKWSDQRLNDQSEKKLLVFKISLDIPV